MAAPSNLYDLGQTLLAAIEAEFVTDAQPLPSRRYVTFAEPVGECDALIVAWERIYVGVPGQAEAPIPLRHSVARVAQFSCWIWRCLSATPQSEGINISQVAPPVDALQADAARVLTDAFVLHRGLGRAKFSEEIRGFCEAMSLGPAEPVIGGGMGAVKMTVLLELS